MRAMANHEIVTIALYLLGGERKSVHTEDIALKSQEIAPGRFSWVKHKEMVDKEAVRKRLWDARKASRGAYVAGSDLKGWILTSAGVRFAEAQIPRMELVDLSRTRLSLQEGRWMRREKARILASDVYAKYVAGGPQCIDVQEANRILRLGDYVSGDLKRERTARVLNLFREDRDVGRFLRCLVEISLGERRPSEPA